MSKCYGTDNKKDHTTIRDLLMGHIVEVGLEAPYGSTIDLIYDNGKRIQLEPLGWDGDAIGVVEIES
jgi:hypothetical protein